MTNEQLIDFKRAKRLLGEEQDCCGDLVVFQSQAAAELDVVVREEACTPTATVGMFLSQERCVDQPEKQRSVGPLLVAGLTGLRERDQDRVRKDDGAALRRDSCVSRTRGRPDPMTITEFAFAHPRSPSLLRRCSGNEFKAWKSLDNMLILPSAVIRHIS